MGIQPDQGVNPVTEFRVKTPKALANLVGSERWEPIAEAHVAPEISRRTLWVIAQGGGPGYVWVR